VGVTPFVARERPRAAASTEARRALAQGLRGSLPTLVAGLIQRGARRVVLFGSLQSGDVDEASDVDVAVAGVDPSSLPDAASWSELVMGRPVDLVRIEDASPGLLAAIEAGLCALAASEP